MQNTWTHTHIHTHSSADALEMRWWQMTLMIILSYVYVRERRRREAYHHNFNNSFGIIKTWAADFSLPEWKASCKVNVILTSLNLAGPLFYFMVWSHTEKLFGFKSIPTFQHHITERTDTTALQSCSWSKPIHDYAWVLAFIKTNGVKMSEGTEQSIRSIHRDRMQRNGF